MQELQRLEFFPQDGSSHSRLDGSRLDGSRPLLLGHGPASEASGRAGGLRLAHGAATAHVTPAVELANLRSRAARAGHSPAGARGLSRLPLGVQRRLRMGLASSLACHCTWASSGACACTSLRTSSARALGPPAAPAPVPPVGPGVAIVVTASMALEEADLWFGNVGL
jgi:hypothetical protein